MKHRNNIIIVFVLLLIISIGFSVLSSNLNIIGNSLVKSNSWDIHFENVQVKEGSVNAPTPQINASGNQVTFNITLNNIDDYYEFYVDVVNDGTIDGMIDLIDYPDLTETEESFLDYTFTYVDGGNISRKDLLTAGNSLTILVRVNYKENGALPENDYNSINLSFSIDYIQADDRAEPIRLVKVEKHHDSIVGSIYAVGSEQFYLINDDFSSGSAILLAKHNLYVGQVIQNHQYVRDIVSNEPGYGLQSPNTIYDDATDTFIGGIDFAQRVYWNDISGNLLDKYNLPDNSYSNYDNTMYDNLVYDKDLTVAPAFQTNHFMTWDDTSNYSIAYYVEPYLIKLENLGLHDSTIRLLTYREAYNLFLSHRDILFNDHTLFWLGSTYFGNVYYISCFVKDDFDIPVTNPIPSADPIQNSSIGVRPVIVLPANSLPEIPAD